MTQKFPKEPEAEAVVTLSSRDQMKSIKIFLASSSELEGDRLQIERMLERKNRILRKRGIEFELIHWEYFIDTISKTRLQDEYNSALSKCDLFVLLAFTKIGEFSKEEFEVAYAHFRHSGAPQILVYFKNAAVKIHEIPLEEIKSLHEFKEAVHNIGHFPTRYESVEQLKNHLYDQLEKLYVHQEDLDKVEDLPSNRNLDAKEALENFYRPILHRLKKDDEIWRLSSKLSTSPDALPKDASENLEENVILPNHREIVQILKEFSHLKLKDPLLDEEIGKYIRHVAIFETIRRTDSMSDLNPIDLNSPYPQGFKAAIERHIEQLEVELNG